MADTAEAFARLMAAHRSIRAYEDRPIAPELVDTVCAQALAGSSSSGNLNMVSVVRTRDLERERRLYEIYFEQPMVDQAPPVMTFCADTFRTVPDFSPHGTRGTAATLLREHGFSRDVVELLLAHAERNKVTAAYHHTRWPRSGNVHSSTWPIRSTESPTLRPPPPAWMQASSPDGRPPRLDERRSVGEPRKRSTLLGAPDPWTA